VCYLLEISLDIFRRLIEWIVRAISELLEPNLTRPSQVMLTVRPSTPIVVGPAPVVLVGPTDTELSTVQGSTIIGPDAPTIVDPPARAAWDEQGWLESQQNNRRIYEGAYRVRRRSGAIASYAGRIVLENGQITPYIADPPAQIKRHPKGACFQLTNPPWFRVHWHRPATNVDDALLYVERVLSEALH